MKTYNLITNDYEITKELEDKLLAKLNELNWVREELNPEIVFVVGGDGTFLKAVSMYSNNLQNTVFVPFKSGGIGFYTNHNFVQNSNQIIEALVNNSFNTFEYELLKVEFNNKVKYAANEIKIINDANPIYVDINIDNKFLEKFWGSGLVLSTSNGSTGFIKSAHGAVIYSDNAGIYELQELNPVSTNKFRTLNSPLILSKDNVITLTGEVKGNGLSIDTIREPIASNEIKISLAPFKLKVASSKSDINKIDVLRDIFIKDKE